MNRGRHLSGLCGVLLSAALLLSACGGTKDGTASAGDTLSDEYITESEIRSVIEKTVAAPHMATATALTAGNGGVTVDAGGVYVLSGETAGRITVDAKGEDVTLILNGVTVSCADSSALYVYKAKSVTLWLAEGTENVFSDGETYSYADTLSSKADEEPNACIYSKADLIIGGAGTLTVNGRAQNGITGKDTLRIETAAVQVTAKNHGINGKDMLTVKGASVTVESGGDALRSTNDSDKKCGCVLLSEAALSLTAGEDAVQAETVLFSEESTVTAQSGGGSAVTAADGSAKGLKAGAGMLLTSGSYTLDCADDAVHSNGSVSVTGGTYVLETGDDGIHADENVTVSAGAITVKKSYEGIEGQTVDITGGTLDITASDDGINAAGGNDGSGFGGGRGDTFGPRGGTASGSDSAIRIAGGSITVNAGGDGIDSNGSLTVTGGELYVSGPTDSGNGALDYDGTGSISGGTVVAVGASGMAQNFGEQSAQGSILLSFNSFGTGTVTLKNADGETLASYTPAKQYNSVVVSAPALKQGETYTVEACGQTQTVTLSSLIYGGGMQGGFGGGRGDGGRGEGGKERPNGRGEQGGTPPALPDGEQQGGTPPEPPDGRGDSAGFATGQQASF